MRSIRRRLVAILVIAFIVIFGEIALASAIKKNQELIQPPIKITQAFKDIAYNPDSSQPNNIPNNPNVPIEEKTINDFAWKVFVGLNWPVDCKGKPLYYTDPLSNDKYPKIIGQAPEAPRRWELYPSPKDLFLPNGAIPPSLDQVPEDERCLNDFAGSEIEYKQNLRLTEAEELAKKEEFSEAKIATRKDLLAGSGELKSELNIDGKLVRISVEDINGAIKIPVVDGQGNYIVNEVRLNPVEYNQIVANKWYAATELIELIKSNVPSKNQFNLVCSNGEKTEKNKTYCEQHESEGAIEIKAVWRIFDSRNTEKEKAKYYTTKRKIVSTKGEILEEQAELGLIGFHIMHKTSSRGWIWSTFEHIDNAPSCEPGDTDEKKRPYTYSLYNNECKTGNCEKNWPYVKSPYFWDSSNHEPKAVTVEGIAIKDQIRSQICRANKIRVSATDGNKEWQESLRAIAESSVWQYYKLIGTQWLENPQLPYSNRRTIMPVSPPLVNTALEPYAQGVSCIVCHTSAHLSGQGNFCQLNIDNKIDNKNCADFSFLMDNAQ